MLPLFSPRTKPIIKNIIRATVAPAVTKRTKAIGRSVKSPMLSRFRENRYPTIVSISAHFPNAESDDGEKSKIIPAIKSRCANFRFNNIDNKYICEKLISIKKNEKLSINNNIIETIALLSNGDLRKAINILQSLSMNDNITINKCYEITGTPTPDEINKILNTLTDKNIDFNKAYNIINEIITIEGYSLSIILKELIVEIIKLDNMINIISELSDLENMLSKSTFDDIYVSVLISIFKKNAK